jgi:hypothetical protein
MHFECSMLCLLHSAAPYVARLMELAASKVVPVITSLPPDTVAAMRTADRWRRVHASTTQLCAFLEIVLGKHEQLQLWHAFRVSHIVGVRDVGAQIIVCSICCSH